MGIIEEVTPLPATPGIAGITLRGVSPRRWRVLDAAGRVIGHLRAESCGEGIRFHAERFDPRRRAVRALGAFWSAAEAVDCLRYLR